LAAKLALFFELRKFLRIYLRNLWILRQLSANGCDDEATEGAVELVRSCTKELCIGAFNVFVGGFAVLDVTVMPIGEAFRVGHLILAAGYCLGERADSTHAAFGQRSGVRVSDCVSVRATVAGTHDDTFFSGEFATEMVKRKGGFNFSHDIININKNNKNPFE